MTPHPPTGPHPAGLGAATADVPLALLRGGVLVAVPVAVLVTVVAAVDGGARAALGSGVGALLGLAGLAAVPLLMRRVARWEPVPVMAAAVGLYLTTVTVLGVVYLLLRDQGWLSLPAAGVGLLASTVGFTAGMAWATARLRVLAYGDSEPPAR